jgi:hypothetical protein
MQGEDASPHLSKVNCIVVWLFFSVGFIFFGLLQSLRQISLREIVSTSLGLILAVQKFKI